MLHCQLIRAISVECPLRGSSPNGDAIAHALLACLTIWPCILNFTHIVHPTWISCSDPRSCIVRSGLVRAHTQGVSLGCERKHLAVCDEQLKLNIGAAPSMVLPLCALCTTGPNCESWAHPGMRHICFATNLLGLVGLK